METKVRILDSNYHIIKGHPGEYIQVIDGLGFSQNRTVRTTEGQLIQISKIVSMQVNK